MSITNKSTIMHSLVVPIDQKPIRIDTFIGKHFPDYSRTFLQKLIEQNLITINNQPVKQSTLVKPHDAILISIPPEPLPFILNPTDEEKTILENLKVKVIYAGEDFLILDKPAGLIVHKPSSYSNEITLVDWLLYYAQELSEVGNSQRPGIVHRLDKDTSGLIIIPRNNQAHALFTKMFKDRAIKKTYLAVVQGYPEKEGTIDLPIGRNPIIRNQMAINGIESRESTTHYKVLKYLNDAALVEVSPVTGRTHQIRIHFKALGHPLIGDEVYASKSLFIKRQALHALKVAFNFKGKEYSFITEIPQDIEQLVHKLQ